MSCEIRGPDRPWRRKPLTEKDLAPHIRRLRGKELENAMAIATHFHEAVGRIAYLQETFARVPRDLSRLSRAIADVISLEEPVSRDYCEAYCDVLDEVKDRIEALAVDGDVALAQALVDQALGHAENAGKLIVGESYWWATAFEELRALRTRIAKNPGH